MNNASLELGGTNWAEKDGNILGYSVGDTSGKFSPQEFTFARGSNLSATRINKAGLIVKGRENLLLQSNNFNTTWVKTGYTLTSGQSGYDGSNDAWLAQCTSAGQALYQTSNASGVTTFSMYLKQGTANFLRLRADQSADAIAVFDLSNGSVHSSNSNVIKANIVDLGSGWYRCSMTWNIDTLSNVQVRAEDGNGSPILGTFYIQDAQLEQGLAASPYIETTSTTAEAGVLENTPRLNYTTGVANPYLLLEPSRTNLMTNSEYTGAYLKSNITATSNQATSPEGVNNATKIETTSTGQCHMRAGFSSSTGNHTGSVFVKKQDFDFIYMEMGGAFAWFNINTGAKGNGNSYGSDWTYVDHSIEDYGNGWYRCIIIGNCLTAGSYSFRSIQPVNGNSSYNSNLSGGVTYWYGATLESNASYATSYIPTYGTSQTRVYDTLNDLDLDGMFSGDSYTILFDIDLNNTFNNKVFATAKKSTGSSSFTFRNFNGLLRVYNNLDSIYLTGSIASDSNKWVVRIDGSTADIFSYNSGSPTKTNGTALTTIRDFGKINFSGGNSIFSLNQFLVFPTALTDSECIALTTI